MILFICFVFLFLCSLKKRGNRFFKWYYNFRGVA
ncbi:MAG TPA: hypothetical protein DEH02_02735 [Bacteroidales bacterium]|nr:hypothetical protein [Bacteroidales bacterium]